MFRRMLDVSSMPWHVRDAFCVRNSTFTWLTDIILSFFFFFLFRRGRFELDDSAIGGYRLRGISRVARLLTLTVDSVVWPPDPDQELIIPKLLRDKNSRIRIDFSFSGYPFMRRQEFDSVAYSSGKVWSIGAGRRKLGGPLRLCAVFHDSPHFQRRLAEGASRNPKVHALNPHIIYLRYSPVPLWRHRQSWPLSHIALLINGRNQQNQQICQYQYQYQYQHKPIHICSVLVQSYCTKQFNQDNSYLPTLRQPTSSTSVTPQPERILRTWNLDHQLTLLGYQFSSNMFVKHSSSILRFTESTCTFQFPFHSISSAHIFDLSPPSSLTLKYLNASEHQHIKVTDAIMNIIIALRLQNGTISKRQPFC